MTTLFNNEASHRPCRSRPHGPRIRCSSCLHPLLNITRCQRRTHHQRLKKEKAKRNSIESTDELPARVLVWKVMDWIFILFYLLTWKIMPKRVSKPFWPKDSPLIKWAIVKFGHQKGGFFYFVFSQSYVLASYDIVWRHCWPSLLFVVIIKLNILVLFFFGLIVEHPCP